MDQNLKVGTKYPMESSNIAALSVKEEKCYTDDVTRQVLVVDFKRGASYRYWPAGKDDLKRGCKANEGHALGVWFQDFKEGKNYEKIIE